MKTLSLLLPLLLTLCGGLHAQNCSNTSVGFTPINDLGAGTYQGFEGGLYSSGMNSRPAGHEAAGLSEAAQVQPLDANGSPDLANGAIVLLSIGMSNTSQEFGAFLPMANGDPEKNPQVVVVNGAIGGWAIEDIDDPNSAYWGLVEQRLLGSGVTPLQVQAIWFKEANRGPTGGFPAHAQNLQGQFATTMQILRDKYPNARLSYCSSRIYAGYATTSLNPEPYAYESGFSVKWLIEQQVGGDPNLNFDPMNGSVEAPWISWGPYMWADGLVPRSDGLIWECDDFKPDGTHPSADKGAPKVAGMLLDFFKSDTTTKTWFTGGGGGGQLVLTQGPLRVNHVTDFSVSGALAGETVYYLYTLSGLGAGLCPGQLGGLCLDLLNPVVNFGNAPAGASGTAVLSFLVPPNAPPRAFVYTQAVVPRGAGGAESVKSNTVTDRIRP